MNNHHIIIFDLIGVLVDGYAVRQNYRQQMAQMMSERYGKSHDFWEAIDEQIVADWAYYHADLNFGGQDGIADIHESLFRVTRALFKIGHVPEPPKPEITALSQDLISLPYGDTLLPDVQTCVEKYINRGYQIGVLSYFLHAQTNAIINGTAIANHITHIISPDTINHYNHDRDFFVKVVQLLRVSPEQLTIVTSSPQSHTTATQASMTSILVRQSSASLEAILEANITERRKT